jgi:hypothetical protein
VASVYLVTIYITLCPFFVRTFYTILHRDIYITRLFLHSTLHRDIFFHHVERQLHTLYTETIFLVMNVAWVNVTFPAATICDDFGVSTGVLYQASQLTSSWKFLLLRLVLDPSQNLSACSPLAHSHMRYLSTSLSVWLCSVTPHLSLFDVPNPM